MKSKFKHYPIRPKRLTASFAKKEYAKLLVRVQSAEVSPTPDLWLSLYEDWNALKSYLNGEASRIYFAYSQDVSNKKMIVAEKYLREKLAPAVNQPEYQLTQAFLASRHREALAERFGQQLLPIYETILKPLNPINTQLRVKVSRLTNRYNQMIAKASVVVNGKTMTLSKAAAYLDWPDPKLRREAFLAIRQWFFVRHNKLAKIYDQLVRLRGKMARNVGFDSYIPYGYQLMGRTDYGLKEVEKFRESIRRYIVPLQRQVTARQVKNLKAKSLRPWDAGYDPEVAIPPGIVPIDSQLDKTQELFDKLSPIFASHFKYMRRHKLIDLENRPNKYAGAFCTEFSDEGKVAVLCNSVGDVDDIRTLSHELGHAFQGYESDHIPVVDLQWGSYDLAEVFSMGMEFLVLPHIEVFFNKQNAQKYRLDEWRRNISLLCYVCVVDEFQHWIYANPKALPAKRDDKWQEIADKYLSPADWSGFKKYQKLRWYAQGHIFNSPFYYIDYALAAVGAMQLAIIADKNPQKALRVYLKMARSGGTRSVLKAFAYGGLRSPFDPGLIKDLSHQAEKVLL